MRSNPEWTPKEFAHATVMHLIQWAVTHVDQHDFLDALSTSDRDAVLKQMGRLHNKIGDQARLSYNDL